MECHAWINPYRAKTKGTTALAASHPYFKNPERFFHYDGLMLFDPGLPENRDYICRVAMDIVETELAVKGEFAYADGRVKTSKKLFSL